MLSEGVSVRVDVTPATLTCSHCGALVASIDSRRCPACEHFVPGRRQRHDLLAAALRGRRVPRELKAAIRGYVKGRRAA
ncbi:MAG: hypothetical protein ACRDHY_03105 [Anaerolineales bacterium]